MRCSSFQICTDLELCGEFVKPPRVPTQHQLLATVIFSRVGGHPKRRCSTCAPASSTSFGGGPATSMRRFQPTSGQVVLFPVLKSIVAFRGNLALAVMRTKKDPMAFFLIFVGFLMQELGPELYFLFS
jgi:hypothetical protein